MNSVNIVAILKKSYIGRENLDKECLDFIVEYNHKKNCMITAFKEAMLAWEYDNLEGTDFYA